MTSLGSFVANTGPWPGAVLLDTAKAFFTALGAREMDMSFAGSAAGKADLRASYKRAKIAGFTGDLEGEGMLLGGVLVVGSDGRVALARREAKWGDKADPAEVLAAARVLAVERAAL